MQLSGGGPTMSHVFFADDLFLFGEAFESQANIIDRVLRRFCRHSRQKVNMSKSKLFMSNNVGGTIAQTISEKWEIPLTDDLGKYLGVPGLHERVNKYTY